MEWKLVFRVVIDVVCILIGLLSFLKEILVSVFCKM